MSSKKELGGEVVEEYINEYIHNADKPMSKIGLARLIYNENKALFKSVDAIRSTIRYQTGAYGKNLRKHIDKDKIIKGKAHPTNPYGLPQSEEKEWKPYVLPKNANNILLLSDIHIPYHNIESVTLALDYGKKEKINTIYLNGDIMDCYKISRWDTDPRKRDFSYELDCTRGFLKMLRKEFPKAHIYYKIGNHEERYEKFLMAKGKELLGIEEFELSNLLRFGELGIHLVEDKQVCHAGKLNILHGHEFGRSTFSPVNAARGYYTRAKESMIAGHNHQTSEHTESSLSGEIVTVWSTGCMSELHPDYMPINRWNRGFAHIKVEKSGDYKVKNIRIVKGKIV